MLTAERLREVLTYCPKTGEFRRHGRPGVAGGVKPVGYRYITVDGKAYTAGRLAWLYMTGSWPKETIDHKNGNSTDERWSNLREATYAEQNANRRVRKDSKAGLKGIHRSGRGWTARLVHGGKKVNLGTFSSPEEAHAVWVAAANAAHGEFARAA